LKKGRLKMKINLSENEIAVLIKCIDSEITSWINYQSNLLVGKPNEKRRLEGILLNSLKAKFCNALMELLKMKGENNHEN
jgi:hypothetical protein